MHVTPSWREIKKTIRTELLSRELAQPRTRLAALDHVEEMLGRVYPRFGLQPEVVLSIPETQLRERLAAFKSNGSLNGAEKSVLHNIYQALRGGIGSQTRQPTSASSAPEVESGRHSEKRQNKLAPIAEAVAAYLEEGFGRSASYSFEVKLPWLDALPSQVALGSAWNDTCNVYTSLMDQRFSLPDRIAQHEKDLQRDPQRVDIWFADPYSFAVEFDEDQHFNQFRLLTLQNFPGYDALLLDYTGYIEQCKGKRVKPGKSGFTRLKGIDPLFPSTYQGEAQDNRVRQRAFRDLLKDVVPWVRSDTNPTWRVGSYIVGGKRSGFTKADCRAVVEHLQRTRALERIRLTT